MKSNFSHNLPEFSDILCGMAFEGKDPMILESVDKDAATRLMAALKAMGFKGKKGEIAAIPAPQGFSVSHLLIVGLGEKGNLKPYDALYIGAGICAHLQKYQGTTLSITLKGVEVDQPEAFAAQVASGFWERSYHFLKYHTYEKNKQTLRIQDLHLVTDYPQMAEELYYRERAVIEGTFYSRDLLCEPPNVLYPNAMAERIKDLESLGVHVQILDEKEMQALGMNALLGVGQGSIYPPRLAIMKWNGLGNSEAPLAFVGKGITFDTGGISIKPSAKMDEMKYDMGGAAIVAGLMKSLALRKAKVNAVGVVALAENMPDGGAQRPGDIVKSMSGQTIEILDTDAEGRLVLADALWYTQQTFKPRFIIDLATLTGAIIVCLGDEYAGMFTPDDQLAHQLTRVGDKTNEKVWRMPLSEAYDKMIDSDIADMKNISPRRMAGSSIAAQFLGRFIKDTPWAHLDVAGVVWGSTHPLSGKYPTGYGIRLLNALIAEHYES